MTTWNSCVIGHVCVWYFWITYIVSFCSETVLLAKRVLSEKDHLILVDHYVSNLFWVNRFRLFDSVGNNSYRKEGDNSPYFPWRSNIGVPMDTNQMEFSPTQTNSRYKVSFKRFSLAIRNCSKKQRTWWWSNLICVSLSRYTRVKFKIRYVFINITVSRFGNIFNSSGFRWNARKYSR